MIGESLGIATIDTALEVFKIRDTTETQVGFNALEHVRALSQVIPLDRGLRITVHFHPDIPDGQSTVIASLKKERIYRSQFETGLSNGGLTALRGGDRWKWESRIFGGHFDKDGSADMRPKYGSLNFRNDPYGGSPRFGSCYLRLNESTLDRASFCFPDSFLEPTNFGTADRFALIELAEAQPFPDPIDSYIEAHVHGIMKLPDDVEAIVLDPSYLGTDVEADARATGCLVEWHSGYQIGINELQLHLNYRGPEVVSVAAQIARDNYLLTPRSIGLARATSEWDPQLLKKVWHSIARYGRSVPFPFYWPDVNSL